MGGPVRVGIFAQAGSAREQAGASYWGIMELSGNLCERPVSICNLAGRGFTGLPGDGVLAANGDADTAFWPGVNASAAGFRGGYWDTAASYARASDRALAAYVRTDRTHDYGGRAVRTAP